MKKDLDIKKYNSKPRFHPFPLHSGRVQELIISETDVSVNPHVLPSEMNDRLIDEGLDIETAHLDNNKITGKRQFRKALALAFQCTASHASRKRTEVPTISSTPSLSASEAKPSNRDVICSQSNSQYSRRSLITTASTDDTWQTALTVKSRRSPIIMQPQSSQPANEFRRDDSMYPRLISSSVYHVSYPKTHHTPHLPVNTRLSDHPCGGVSFPRLSEISGAEKTEWFRARTKDAAGPSSTQILEDLCITEELISRRPLFRKDLESARTQQVQNEAFTISSQMSATYSGPSRQFSTAESKSSRKHCKLIPSCDNQKQSRSAETKSSHLATAKSTPQYSYTGHYDQRLYTEHSKLAHRKDPMRNDEPLPNFFMCCNSFAMKEALQNDQGNNNTMMFCPSPCFLIKADDFVEQSRSLRRRSSRKNQLVVYQRTEEDNISTLSSDDGTQFKAFNRGSIGSKQDHLDLWNVHEHQPLINFQSSGYNEDLNERKNENNNDSEISFDSFDKAEAPGNKPSDRPFFIYRQPSTPARQPSLSKESKRNGSPTSVIMEGLSSVYDDEDEWLRNYW